jgi:hypothetical protein
MITFIDGCRQTVHLVPMIRRLGLRIRLAL